MTDNPASLIIYGAGYLGRQYLHHLRSLYGSHRILGFADDVQPAGEQVTEDLATLGPIDDVARRPGSEPAAAQVVFAIGYSNMAARREALDRVTGLGYSLFSIVHPAAMIEPGARYEPGAVILAGAVLDQETVVGAACFIDIGVRLGAGTVVGTNTYVSSGTSTGSRARIGDDCFIGMDCTITTDVKVGNRVFVNAKTLVARDTADDVRLVEMHKSRELPNG